MRFDAVKAFALDMDGTFYLGDTLLPGSLAFIAQLKRLGIPYRFLTNNSARSAKDYLEKLAGMGLPREDALVYSSGEAAAAYLMETYPAKKVYVLGTPSLQQSFAEAGVRVVEEGAEVAVLGYDTTLTYSRLTRFCDLVRAGLPYIATHPDVNCPVLGGYAPDAGAMMALVEASTGRKADLVIGKPNPEIMRRLAKAMGVQVSEIAMVGDRLYTDIALGRTAGVQTVLVLSGETKAADLAASEAKPDLVCQNLGELGKLLEAHYQQKRREGRGKPAD